MMLIAPPNVRMVAVMPKHFRASNERHIAQYWRARERIRNTWFRGFTKTVRKQFASELSSVRNAITGDDISNIDVEVRKALATGRKDWTKLYKGLYVGMMDDIAPMVIEQYGDVLKSRSRIHVKEASPWTSFLMSWLNVNVGPKVDGLLDFSWTKIHSQVLEGMENQEGMDDIFARIDSLYGDQFSTTRSMTIARTEVTAASNIGTQKTGEYLAERFDLDITKKWITARDANVRDSHIAMEGVEVPLDELFNVNGSMMLCPGDTSNGAELSEVINCRCDVVQHVDGT